MRILKIENLYKTLIITILSAGFQFLFASIGFSQAAKGTFNNETYKINWQEPQRIDVTDNLDVTYLSFDNAIYDINVSKLPFWVTQIPVSAPQIDQVRLSDVTARALTAAERDALDTYQNEVPTEFEIDARVITIRKKFTANISMLPVRKNEQTGIYEKLISFKIELSTPSMFQNNRSKRSRTFKFNSVLRAGDWFKLGVTEDGIYRLTFSQLESLGLNVSNLSSDQLRIFGNGGRMLPFDNSEPRIDDLKENAIQVVDGGDGAFNEGDYILFYGHGPHGWRLDGNTYKRELNFMSDTAYYFVTRNYAVGSPKRIVDRNSLDVNPDVVVSTNDFHLVHEQNLKNLIISGRRWFGEEFNINTNYSFDFTVPSIVAGSAVRLNTVVAGRTFGTSSTFNVSVGSNSVSIPVSSVPNNYVSTYARTASEELQFNANGDQVNVEIDFQKGTSIATGWLDYLELTGQQQLRYNNDQLLFRNKESMNAGVVQYDFINLNSNLKIWDVTDPTTAVNQLRVNNRFKINGGVLSEFVLFADSDAKNPALFGKIGNQDLHALRDIDYVMVTHPKFLNQAEQLAAFHRQEYNYDVAVVTTNEVYNEFSSGSQDMTAIKDLMKMLYDRAGMNESRMPKYLLLFGDASYDLKYRIPENTNYVVSYQSRNSTSPTQSFISDDYFGFLDDSESDEITSGLDIGVGRLPVKTTAEAQAVVNKIIEYHNPANTLGAWRTWLSFVADDEDNNVHMRDANKLAVKVDTNHPQYNQEKIFFDAYPQVTNSGGEEYPDVTEAINNRVDRGALFLSYVGHGGELGWAHERVLGVTDVNNWSNSKNMPLFLTATCEFSRFDDPARNSAGELTLLNPRGGGIALLTTTRLVYSTPNYELSDTFMDYVFDFQNGVKPTLGDLLRECKTNSNINQGNGVNYRNFSLLGDPAMQLAYPEHNVITTSMPDTLKALQKVTITGYVADVNGTKLTNFNGVVYPTVFNSEKDVVTLNNDGTGSFNYSVFENIIFRGRASVTNGEFSFSFVVPKDISIDYGTGRISYYADNSITDAAGFYEDFLIGGRDEFAAEDNQGPEVQLWMNDETFVMGGITDQNPAIYSKVFDENGINTVGTGIGHDIQATLNEESANAIVLNDFYESDMDSYQSGTIRYPLSDLPNGKHTLKLRVWDVYNNPSEAYTEFIVADNSDLAIEHVLNYPNPFTTNTSFYFEHNAPGQNLEVRIEVFTVSGKLVKIIDGIHGGEGYRVGPVNWDGRDDFGDRIGRGTYIYRVKVKTPTGKSVEEYEKLVILN